MAIAEAKKAAAKDFLGTGRRKTSVARVRIRSGSGSITINGRPYDRYFLIDQDRRQVLSPLQKTGKESSVDVIARCNGGGITGQAGAVMLGLARALKAMDGDTEATLRQNHLLTRDGR